MCFVFRWRRRHVLSSPPRRIVLHLASGFLRGRLRACVGGCEISLSLSISASSCVWVLAVCRMSALSARCWRRCVLCEGVCSISSSESHRLFAATAHRLASWVLARASARYPSLSLDIVCFAAAAHGLASCVGVCSVAAMRGPCLLRSRGESSCVLGVCLRDIPPKKDIVCSATAHRLASWVLAPTSARYPSLSKYHLHRSHSASSVSWVLVC